MLHSTHRLLLVAFLGALALFATTVTPALFATLPPGSAARVVGRVLPVLDGAGLVLGLLAVALGATGRSGRAAVVLGAVLAALAAASRFGMLHGLSTVLFGLQAVLAVALVALRPGRSVPRGRTGR